MSRVASWLAASVLLLAPAIACAQALTVESLEHGSWSATVSALQHDVHGQGAVMHVVVSDPAGDRVTCGSYTLELDANGAQAFRVLGCDPRTQATALELVSRHALFAHGGPVAEPRSIGLRATATRVQETHGGASPGGGSELTCSVAIRPYLDDLEQGTHVYLTPDRYVVRPRAADVSVANGGGGAGWVLRSGARASLRIEYDVVERSTGEVVLHQHAELSCQSGAGHDAAETAAEIGRLAIRTLEHGPWPATVAAIRAELSSQGRTLHVVLVGANGQDLACARYRLAVDDGGAFRIGTCDPASGATELIVLSHEAVVASDLRPPRVTLLGTDRSSGCSATIHPYIGDLDGDQRVVLTPERYRVRVLTSGVTAEQAPGGWVLHGAHAAPHV